MATDAELAEFTRFAHEQIITTAGDTSATIGDLWTTVGGLTDAQQEEFATIAARTVSSAQTQTAALTQTYLVQMVSMMEDKAPMQVESLDLEELRDGVDPVEVYRRPTVEARVAVSRGVPYSQAMQRGLRRATQLADTDVMNAQRYSARKTFSQIPQVVGYRRVPNGGACIFCQLASVQRYHIRDLMPIHPSCHCGVAPIVGNRDPGRTINEPLHDKLQKDGSLDVIQGRQDRARERGTVDREQAALERERQSLRDTRSQILAEQDPRRLRRLREREANWQQRVDERRAKIAQLEDQPPTVKVAQHPELGPVLTGTQ